MDNMFMVAWYCNH